MEVQMTKFLYCAVIAASLGAITPVAAQGVYIGPNGVGVDTGVRPYRDHDRDYYRDRDRDVREGRSAYERRDHRYDDHDDD
jgi:hypothetical protein